MKAKTQDLLSRALPFSSTLRPIAKWILQRTWYRRALYLPPESDRPFLLRLDVNNTCNLLCKKCFYPEFSARGIARQQMPLDDFRTLASRLFRHTYSLQLACSFESLLHPQFPGLLREIDRHGVPNVGMVTNGTLLTGERAEAIARSKSLKDLSISVNALTPETYQALHGKPMLERVKENVERFLELRRRLGGTSPRVKINTVITRTNLEELDKVLEWSAAMGIDEAQFFHIEPFGEANDESVATAADEYNAVRDRLRAAAREKNMAIVLPPPILPEYYNPVTGHYEWLHTLDAAPGESPPAPTEKTDPADRMPLHPYPSGVHCICPWMTLIIDCWGNLYPCGHRMAEPFANILRQPREEALNSIRILKLRRQILQGRHEQACPFCKPSHTYSDPMKRRATHVEFKEREIQDLKAEES